MPLLRTDLALNLFFFLFHLSSLRFSIPACFRRVSYFTACVAFLRPAFFRLVANFSALRASRFPFLRPYRAIFLHMSLLFAHIALVPLLFILQYKGFHFLVLFFLLYIVIIL